MSNKKEIIKKIIIKDFWFKCYDSKKNKKHDFEKVQRFIYHIE